MSRASPEPEAVGLEVDWSSGWPGGAVAGAGWEVGAAGAAGVAGDGCLGEAGLGWLGVLAGVVAAVVGVASSGLATGGWAGGVRCSSLLCRCSARIFENRVQVLMR